MGDFDDDKRKRYDEDSDDEDLNFSDVDEDEDEDESDDSGAPHRKRRKTEGRTDLVLMEAEEDDDDEDDEDDDFAGDDLIEGAGEEIGGGSDNEETRKKHRELLRTLNNDDDANLKEFAERYKQSTNYVSELDDLPLNSKEAFAIKQSLLPTIQDPTMWCARCQEGKEREVVRALLAKFLIAELGPKELRLHIFSAHCVDGDRGRFYVEARKESHVTTAIAQIPFVRSNIALKMLSRLEMPRVLVAPEKQSLTKGSWVRVKSGIYRDDLALVVRDSEDDRVRLQIVPRIPAELLQADRGNGRAGVKRARKGTMRPMQKLFNPSDVLDSHAVVANGSGYRWRNMEFKNGFLIKDFRISSLNTSNISPTLEEMNKFKLAEKAAKKKGENGEAENDDDEMEVDDEPIVLKDPSATKTSTYAKGDKIQVTRGEFISVVGVVTAVNAGNVEFRPDDTQLYGKKVLSVPASHVRKYFPVGTHVKVLNGIHAGETGVITAVIEDTASIYTDTVHKEIKALMSDLQISYSTGTGNTRLGNYELFDLVQVGDSVGVIVEVERDGFKILDDTGTTQHVPLSAVGGRRNVRNASTGDAHNNYVSLGETVRILDGPYKDLTGILKHISRSTVFLYCQNGVKENRGIVCLRRHHIASIVDRSMNGGATGGAMGAPASRPIVHGMGGPGSRRVDPKLANQTVVIVRGQWKGYKGKIKEGGGEREYRIELSSGSRIVKVPKGDVKTQAEIDRNRANGPNGSSFSNNTSSWGDYSAQTPGRMATPHHSANYYDSGPWNPSAVPPTPSRPTVHDDEFDPNYKPAYIPATPAANVVPTTPAVSNYPSTPGMPSAYPSTPGMQSAYPMTPGMPSAYPSTPGMSSAYPSTPGMPSAYPSTPGIPSAYPSTPGMPSAYPSTPGVHMPVTPGMPAQTPSYPMTPGSGYPSYSSGSYGVPATPMGVPATPGGAYPSTPGADLGSSSWNEPSVPQVNPDDWCKVGFEVYDSTSSVVPAPRYIIVEVPKGSSNVQVEALTLEGNRSHSTSAMPKSSLKLVVPQKKDLVAIIASGKIGTLIGIDEQDSGVGGASGIVKNKDDSEIQMLPMSSFAKYHQL